eukprot:CAMPEP_0179890036 /NCGR_PEP_ID=MMETSP0982-20121206/32884_1 /TAXON_ID=483367 /ORGANISM="non described non described, Strain CCMP 2436" /LENGTH=30 /DNA_ID= /DNA_START= /DNA_END= /DNA_ORIENTATION=
MTPTRRDYACSPRLRLLAATTPARRDYARS